MTFSDKAKQIISSVAPLVGTAIGGPFGGLAGAVLGKLFGSADKPADDKTIEAAITSGNPDALLKLKQADNEFAEHMKQLDIDEKKLQYDDIANARSREVAIKDTTPRNLAYLILLGTGAAICATLMGWTKVESALAGTLIGYMISECKSVMQYYFGSSASSKSKDETISDIAKS